MIQTSEQINELATALAKAQAAIENVDATGKNPAFKRDGKESKYAKLSDALDEVRPKLAAQGISVVQMAVNGEGNNIGVATRLLHSSGQWIESTLYVAPTKFDAQGAGSVITYLRRYALMAMTALAPEDDDGNAASLGAPREAPKAGMVRAADVPPQKANSNGTVLPVSAEEPPEMRLKRAAVQLATSIAKAPTDHVLDVLMDDARDDLAAMEKVQEPIFKTTTGLVNGIEAAKRLRALHNAKIGELRSGK